MTLLFVFDMDNVLYEYDWRVRMQLMSELTGYDVAELRRRWWNPEGEWTAEAGGFADATEYLAAFSAAMDQHIDEAEWVRIRAAAMTPWPESIAAVERAAELGTVTLLTNNGPLSMKHLRELAPALVPVFGDHLFTSSHYGARKPEPEVFERVLAAYDAAPEDTFFADDMLVNVEGARRLGITAHLFTDAPGLLAAIEAFAAARTSAR